VAIPALVLVGAFLLSLRDVDVLSTADEEPSVTIEVVAHDWWWEVRYPESGAITANEIHIPTGEPVLVVLRTADVIHSFWVPRLQVKADMIEGRSNELWLEADEPGRYRGQCAEFCGLQHANMVFWVEADPPSEFEDWLADQEADAAPPAGAGLEVFLGSTCVGCHAIRGTEADATVGPDLTHLASRETIAAGIRPNTRAELARWITDPQGVKPGAVMPPTELSADDFDALLDYLESLD
jgi:cytochrome c oxidase subunit II